MEEMIKWLGKYLHSSQGKLSMFGRNWPWVLIALVVLFILV